jgi:hypothetical protein
MFDGGVVIGAAVAAAFSGMWLWYATLAIEISSEAMIVRRFGRIVWSAPLAQTHAHFGKGGELKTHTALILESPHESKQFEILRTMFGAHQVGRMAQMLGARGKVAGGVF